MRLILPQHTRRRFGGQLPALRLFGATVIVVELERLQAADFLRGEAYLSRHALAHRQPLLLANPAELALIKKSRIAMANPAIYCHALYITFAAELPHVN